MEKNIKGLKTWALILETEIDRDFELSRQYEMDAGFAVTYRCP